MKVLMPKGRFDGGSYYVNFTPIHNDWLSWKSHSGDIKIIHEKCYFQLMFDNNEGLPHVQKEEAICAYCGIEAPDTVQQFILIANGVSKL
jgi:hypothetical protein